VSRFEVLTLTLTLASPSHVASNHLLDALPEAVRLAVLREAERIPLPLRTTIYEPGGRIGHVYFPVDGIISVVTVMRDGTQIEVVTVGREGLTGAQALLDGTTASGLTWVQVAGEGYRIRFDTFAALCARYAALRELVEKYLSALLDVMAQSIACNRLHYVNERCARWLLMTHDRVGRDEFRLTHEALATMLGVRRAGVSIAAAGLQQAGHISYARGRFTVVDRAGLERVACECYGAINGAFAKRRLPKP
jgi:CRP-like cAMP-binding protein